MFFSLAQILLKVTELKQKLNWTFLIRIKEFDTCIGFQKILNIKFFHFFTVMFCCTFA